MKGQSLARFVVELKRQLALADQPPSSGANPLRLRRVEADISLTIEAAPDTEAGLRLLAGSSETKAEGESGAVHRVRLEFSGDEILPAVPSAVPTVVAATATAAPSAPPAAVPTKSVLAGLGVEFRALDELSRSEKLPPYLRALLVRKDLPEFDKALVVANLLTLEGDMARHSYVGDILMALDAAELERRLAKTGSAAPPKQ